MSDDIPQLFHKSLTGKEMSDDIPQLFHKSLTGKETSFGKLICVAYSVSPGPSRSNNSGGGSPTVHNPERGYDLCATGGGADGERLSCTAHGTRWSLPPAGHASTGCQ